MMARVLLGDLSKNKGLAFALILPKMSKINRNWHETALLLRQTSQLDLIFSSYKSRQIYEAFFSFSFGADTFIGTRVKRGA